jgi:hypothetical protein
METMYTIVAVICLVGQPSESQHCATIVPDTFYIGQEACETARYVANQSIVDQGARVLQSLCVPVIGLDPNGTTF